MLYIVGVPRSGKSTFIELIKELCPDLNWIATDAIQNAVIHTFPKFSSDEISKIDKQQEIAQIVASLADWNEVLTGQQTIVDVGELPIEAVYKILKPTDKMVCLGFGENLNNEQIWDSIKRHHQEYDYTYGMDFERVKRKWGDFARKDDNNRFFCRQHNIKYIDTAENRHSTLLKEAEEIIVYLYEN